MRVSRKARTRVSARVAFIAAAVTVAIAGHGLWSWTGTRPRVGIAGAQGDGPLDLSNDLPEAVDQDVPAGVFDVEDLDRLPGIRPMRKAPAEVDAAVQALAEERARLITALPADFPPAEPPGLAEDPLGPPRMDSGDPDPDRLEAAPPGFAAGDAKGANQ